MEIKNNKKKWTKPELTVLVRNRPEEAVLTNCHKGSKGGGPDHNNRDNACVSTDPFDNCDIDCMRAYIS